VISDNKTNTNRLSYRQKRALEVWLGNKRRPKAHALREAGYSNAVIRQPQKVFGSIAVQNELNGLKINTRPLSNIAITEPTQTSDTSYSFDISKITDVDLKKLKEMLIDTSNSSEIFRSKQETEIPSHSTRNHEGHMFESALNTNTGNTYKNYSSM